MDKNEFNAFMKCIASLAMAFDREATEVLYDAYWLGLGDLSIEQIRSAVALAIRECQNFPKPVELRRLCGAHIDADARAIAAWGDVQTALPLGSWKHVDFEDKLINATIRNLGGWPGFVGRFTDAEAEKWLRLEFIKTYNSFANSGVSGEAVAPLPGLSQATASGGMLRTPIPKLIKSDAARMRLPEQRTDPIAIAFKRA